MKTLTALLAGSIMLLGLSVGHAMDIMPGDNGRWHGYMPAGYIGAHPSNRGVNSCTWSASQYCANWRARGQANGNGHAAGGCDSTCQAKCQATWRAGGFPNVGACYARWAKLNARGDASQCEYRVGYKHSAPGC